jgi:uncharacterized protein YeaO (DUF488 family)
MSKTEMWAELHGIAFSCACLLNPFSSERPEFIPWQKKATCRTWWEKIAPSGCLVSFSRNFEMLYMTFFGSYKRELPDELKVFFMILTELPDKNKLSEYKNMETFAQCAKNALPFFRAIYEGNAEPKERNKYA